MYYQFKEMFKKIFCQLKSAIDELGLDGNVVDVRTPEEISQLDGLIIPGGESTTIGQLISGKWLI